MFAYVTCCFMHLSLLVCLDWQSDYYAEVANCLFGDFFSFFHGNMNGSRLGLAAEMFSTVLWTWLLTCGSKVSWLMKCETWITINWVILVERREKCGYPVQSESHCFMISELAAILYMWCLCVFAFIRFKYPRAVAAKSFVLLVAFKTWWVATDDWNGDNGL